MGSIVTVNGKTYNLPSGNVSVIGNKVYCDGKLVEDCNDIKEKEITIIVYGENNTIKTDCGDITVNGNANNVSSASGDIQIAGNTNNVSTTSGDVTIRGDIHGNCQTLSGDIKAKQIRNNVHDFTTGKANDFTTQEIIAGVEAQRVKPQVYKAKKKTSWFKELLFAIFGEE